MQSQALQAPDMMADAVLPVMRRGKPRHIDPNFCDEILGCPLTDARDRVQECNDLRERAAQRLNLGFTLGNTHMPADLALQRHLTHGLSYMPLRDVVIAHFSRPP